MAKLVDLPEGRGAGQSYMYKVYAIKSKIKNYIYVGITQNLDERIRRHNNGYEKTTKTYKPFRLIHTETFLPELKPEKERSI